MVGEGAGVATTSIIATRPAVRDVSIDVRTVQTGSGIGFATNNVGKCINTELI